MKIWIDADGCPNDVKDVVFNASDRLDLKVTLVANRWIRTPVGRPNINSTVVSKGLDEADDWIADHVALDDIVITADIPLAARVVARGALAIDPHGDTYTEENVRERLSVRDFMANLRDQGIQTGGKDPWSNRDKRRFANAFDRILTKRMRAQHDAQEE